MYVCKDLPAKGLFIFCCHGWQNVNVLKTFFLPIMTYHNSFPNSIWYPTAL